MSQLKGILIITLGFWSQISGAGSLRTVADLSGKVYQIDSETHRVYSQIVVNQQTLWLGSDRNIYANPEFPHIVQMGPPPPTQSEFPSVSLGYPITQAVNELFGPGIPVRDYTAVNQAAEANAKTAAEANAEIERLRNSKIQPYKLPPFQPTQEQIRRYRTQKIIDVPSLPDSQESELPYRFRSSGEPREKLIGLYQHLYKVQPETGKRKTARELGLASVEEADQSYSIGNIEEGLFYSELAESFLDLTIGLDPVTGIARSAFELIVGRNFVTGAKLSGWEYGFAALNIVSLGAEGPAAAALKGVAKIVSRGSKLIREAVAVGNLLGGGSQVYLNKKLPPSWVSAKGVF